MLLLPSLLLSHQIFFKQQLRQCGGGGGSEGEIVAMVSNGHGRVIAEVASSRRFIAGASIVRCNVVCSCDYCVIRFLVFLNMDVNELSLL